MIAEGRTSNMINTISEINIPPTFCFLLLMIQFLLKFIPFSWTSGPYCAIISPVPIHSFKSLKSYGFKALYKKLNIL